MKINERELSRYFGPLAGLALRGFVGNTGVIQFRSRWLGFDGTDSDWDNGNFFIEANEPVTLMFAEHVAALHKGAKESQSWLAFQSYKKNAKESKLLRIRLPNQEQHRLNN